MGGAGPGLDVGGCVGDELGCVAGVEGGEGGVQDGPVWGAGDGAAETGLEVCEGFLGGGVWGVPELTDGEADFERPGWLC